MIEPKDGEWWVCTCEDYEQVLMLKGSIWVTTSCGKVGAYSTSIITPLYKMVKSEEPKPRTKVAYEKVEETIFDLKDEYYSDGFYTKDPDGNYIKIRSTENLAKSFAYDCIYRKVKKEIDWSDELDYHIRNNTNIDIRDSIANAHKNFPEQFIGTCHLVASLTDKPE